MRGTRWLIIVAIIAILGGVTATYRLQSRTLREQSPAKPQALPATMNSRAQDWTWIQTDHERTVCRITAKDARQAKDANLMELQQVELWLPSQHGDTHDLVHSAHAVYNLSDKRLYSDGDVDITLAVPNEGEPKHTLVSIHSSGVTFDSGTGKASTDRSTAFIFENGTGKAVGASYDPSTHELHMSSQAELDWNAPGPRAKPMKIEAGEVLHREDANTIWLSPWSRLTRDNTVVEAGNTVITLDDRVVHHIEAVNAHGVDTYPSRKLQYGADKLTVNYGDDGEVHDIVGEGHARLGSESEGYQVNATGDRVDLNFEDNHGESVLTKALVTGNGFLESKPLPVAGHDIAESRILRSQIIAIQMRPGGREIDNMETHAPGTLEFLPNRAGQRHRTFTGDHMWIAYGPENRIQSFRAVNCRTQSEPLPPTKPGAAKGAETITVSKNVTATFDPKTNQLTHMEQWDEFSYEEGERKARADRGVLEQADNRIRLENHAHMWDSHEATTADHILLDEKTGNFSAEGHVNSSRMPDQEKNKSDSAMLAGDEPLQAVAQKMVSANHDKLVKYDGDVVLWQGANRIQGDRVEIDREKRTILADGHVITQSREDPKDDDEDDDSSKEGSIAHATAAKKDPGPTVFTLVKAPHMAYTDQDRVAHYSGGVFLNRAGLQVKATDLRSWLAEEGADNRLEKAFADGDVQVVQTGPIRTRIGTSQHAEYYTADDKVVLRGGDPQLNDSLRGNTHGAELTYYSNDDRLLVNGSAAKPSISHIRRKHPPAQ